MDHLFAVEHSYLIPLLPLLGAAIAGFFGAKVLKGQSHWPIWLGVGAAAVVSFCLLFGMIGQSGHHGDDHGAAGHDAAAAVTVHAGETWAQSNPSTFGLTANKDWFNWISAGDFTATAGFWFDPLTAVMLCVVTAIGFFITVFSKGYMVGESGYFRFFAYLGLFIFMMTVLVMGNNLVMLYLGWEGVGLCSYLLIGYYYDKPAAREAAKKAFLVNRIGDFGFGLGIMLVFLVFGTVSYFGSPDDKGFLVKILDPAFIASLPAWKQNAIDWIPFLLMLGAFGKSAQFPLYVWLPDAMEGPTPVSALIHAATMVTAGVYMIARCSTLFVINEAAMITIAIVGCFTAIFAASIALRQFDLKKVFAYSTVSQLGFMFVGVALLAPVAGVFHLVTHAFFKALLFLSSGVVMHAMMGELDLRKMSGLKRVLPKTRWFMLAGCFALAGLFPFSGFWSKDEIIVASQANAKIIGIVLMVTAFMTAYYTFRLYFRVFEGPEIIPPPPANNHAHDAEEEHLAHAGGHDEHGHGDHGHHNHEPLSMMLPLFVLTLGAVFAGLLNLPFDFAGIKGHLLGDFLGQSPSFSSGYAAASSPMGPSGWKVDPVMFGQHDTAVPHVVHVSTMVISGLISLVGILVAYIFHLKDRAKAERMAQGMPAVTRLLEAKYWVDEIYQAGVVEPLRSLGRAFFAVDRIVIDGLVWLVSFVPQLGGFVLKFTTQRGYLQGYAAAMLFGVVVILLIVFL